MRRNLAMRSGQGKRVSGAQASQDGRVAFAQRMSAFSGAGIPVTVQQELTAQGYCLPTTPAEEMVVGNILFSGVVTDNAVTALDLTASGAQADVALLQHLLGGSATTDAEIALVVDGVAIVVHEGDTRVMTGANFRDLERNLYMKHQYGTDALYLPLHGHLRSPYAAINEAGVTAGSPVYRATLPPYSQPIPLRKGAFLVDLSTDVWSIVPNAAIDMAANLDIDVIVSAVAFPSRYIKGRKHQFRGLMGATARGGQLRRRLAQVFPFGSR